ncbi:tetratricopeptide repeat protein [Actinocorallia sp. API 0066]|uniref:tetratricopeptide repeat protein n=1 Tax=Actinocorallia sp. API 0066 TaxID=2896846 RepID=UPI001E648576|nr:tetratricopeptide repeat protein [Actinocorallia sp. API 0066]MCD0450683.1 tetratricopeptide repeat protein [Actinocorallia sp. API 0066]
MSDFSPEAHDKSRQVNIHSLNGNPIFGFQGAPVEDPAPISPPTRTGGPLRGRDALLAELTAAHTAPDGPRVHVLHGMGGAGKTSVAAELATRLAHGPHGASARGASATGASATGASATGASDGGAARNGATNGGATGNSAADDGTTGNSPADDGVAGGADVWWLPAADTEQFQPAIRALSRAVGLTGEQLNAPDHPESLWRALNSRRRPWLLVIDNADEPAVLSIGGRPLHWGTSWLRPVRSPHGLVVVTTRDGGEDTWADWCRLHHVGTLADTDAAHVLNDLTRGRAGPLPDAARLAARLGGLPLALTLAGSFLARTSRVGRAFADLSVPRTYTDCLTALESGTLTLTFPTTPTSDLRARPSGGPLGDIWLMPLAHLEARGLPHARPLLALLGAFPEAPIPYELVLTTASLPTSKEFADLTGDTLWAALAALQDFGLITMDDPAAPDAPPVPLLHLHPLVRDAARTLPHPTFPTLAPTLLTEAADTLPNPNLPASWPSWSALSPHLFAALHHPSARTNTPLLDATNRALSYLIFSGSPRLAESHARAFPTPPTPDSASHLTTRHYIASAMLEQGRYGEAETELRTIHTTQQRVLGEDHPNTLTTRHNIAYAMLGQGRYGEAETELHALHTTQQRVLGEDHPNTLTTRHNIARAMLEQGRYGEAETELRTIHTTCQRVLGEDHPDTLASRHEFAYAMLKQGREEEARREFRAVLEAKIRVLGSDHPSTQATRSWLE